MWQYHDSKLIELSKLYNKTSKQTQNRIQELIDTFNFNSESLYNIADSKTKKRVNNYIDEWKDKGLLKGYFGMLANSIYKRSRVKNSEILELLIYSAYVEEQNKLKNKEQELFKEDIEYYYNEGVNEVRRAQGKQKKYSVIPDAMFLALLDEINSMGYTWQQQVEIMAMNNANQMYRQAIINLIQQKPVEISSNEFQRIIDNQVKQKVNINGNKISGASDLELLALNNKAKVRGIESEDNDAKVIFLANVDGTETPMCHSLNNQEFYINKENVFDRYYGDTAKTLSIQRIRCKGLVAGLNLPPINHHFHWCRSIIQYIPNNNVKLKQNRNYDLIDNIYSSKIEKRKFDKLNIKHIDKKALNNVLNNMEKVYKDFPQIKGKIKQINETNHPRAGMSIQPQDDGSYIMEVNRKFFYNGKVVKEAYKRDVENKYHPKNSTYRDIGIHEAGHMIVNEILKKKYSDTNLIASDWNGNITAQRIVNMAFDKLKINGIIQRKEAMKNISIHASKYNANETIAEAFVDYYVNKGKATDLSKTIIDVTKGMI